MAQLDPPNRVPDAPLPSTNPGEAEGRTPSEEQTKATAKEDETLSGEQVSHVACRAGTSASECDGLACREGVARWAGGGPCVNDGVALFRMARAVRAQEDVQAAWTRLGMYRGLILLD